MKNLAKLLAVGLATVSANTADLANTTTQVASANISSLGNSNSTNTVLAKRDITEGPRHCFSEDHFDQEAYEQDILKAVPNLANVAQMLQGLSKFYTDVKISHTSVDKIKFECIYTYFMSGFYVPRLSAEVSMTITGNLNGKEHSYPIFLSAGKDKNGVVGLYNFRVRPNEENACSLLESISYPKAVKTLQEKNIIPVEALTIKKQECYEANNSRRIYPQGETHYIVEMEIEDTQKIVYKFSAEAGLNRASGLFDYYGDVDYLEWDTSAAKVQNNPLFPTEYFLPKFKCKADMLADQKTLPFNQEIPVKLFNFILNRRPEYYHPKELVGKKYTVSDIKVRSIESKCNQWNNVSDDVLYRMTGILTTSDGLKFKADFEGKLSSTPYEDDDNVLKKLFKHLRGNKDPFDHRFGATKIIFTLIK